MNKETLISRILLITAFIGGIVLFFVSPYILVKVLSLLTITAVAFYFKKFDLLWLNNLWQKIKELKFKEKILGFTAWLSSLGFIGKFNRKWLLPLTEKITSYRLTKEKLFKYISWFFLLCLFTITISNIHFIPKFNLTLSKDLNITLIILVIISGFITFYANREKIEQEEENEKQNEELAEQKRSDEFAQKFPLLSKIPLLHYLFHWCHKEGWWYVIALVLILIMFTAIKAPYFGVSFTGDHPMKYNSYVEPAKYMFENNNPFLNQRKYQANPISNTQGTFKTFDTPPLIEWGLLSTYYLFPNNSLEFNTRLFTHFLGILILLFSYLFFSKWLSKTNSLLITFLISINPIISFLSFVTVEDSLLLIFTFLSLIYLLKYLKNNNFSYLFLCGVLFGIGNASKYSLFLWLAPIIFILLAFSSKKISTFLKNYSTIIVLSLLPIIAFQTSLKYLPTDIIISLLKFFIWVAIFFGLYYFMKRNEVKYEKLIDNIIKHKILCVTSLLLIIALGVLFLYLTGIYKSSNEFLTDSTLIFNWDVYNFMLKEQFKVYMTQNVYYLGLIGFVFSLFLGLKKQRLILLSFFTGSFIYWILASKVIFFHNYYTAIIMVTFCLSIGIMIYTFGKALENKFLFVFLLLAIGLLIFPASRDTNTKRLSKEKSGFAEACDYLIKQTSPEEAYIDGNYILSLTMCSGRPAIDREYLDDQTLRESVISEGFTGAMKKYKIKYLITTGGSGDINYIWFANLYSSNLLSVGYRRSDNILNQLGKEKFFEDTGEREKIITENNVESKIQLEKVIGSYKFYSFY